VLLVCSIPICIFSAVNWVHQSENMSSFVSQSQGPYELIEMLQYVMLLNLYSKFGFVSRFDTHMILLKSGQFMF
jgi:hypothetical protein